MKMEIITLSEICESIYRSFSKFEDIKDVMRNHTSINRRQWNGQKEKGKRWTISTKYNNKANFEQRKTLILSTLKYIRGMWASKLGLLSDTTLYVCYEIHVFGSDLSHKI